MVYYFPMREHTFFNGLTPLLSLNSIFQFSLKKKWKTNEFLKEKKKKKNVQPWRTWFLADISAKNLRFYCSLFVVVAPDLIVVPCLGRAKVGSPRSIHSRGEGSPSSTLSSDTGASVRLGLRRPPRSSQS